MFAPQQSQAALKRCTSLTFWSLWPPQSLVSRKVIETENCNFPNFMTSALLWLCVSLQFISIQEWKWWRQQIDNICWIFSCNWSQNIVENACFLKTRSSPSHAVMGLIGGVKVYQSWWERDQDSSREWRWSILVTGYIDTCDTPWPVRGRANQKAGDLEYPSNSLLQSSQSQEDIYIWID